jgi:2-polyprenyl-3-methyl-5-hydroxy-6-metoxy-1,4-benzoquinol methylase
VVSIEQSRESDRFSAFELAGWETNISGYNRAFGAVARQTVRPMLDAAHVTEGTRVLDVCCGPGILAAGALERGAEAVGLDFSEQAVKLASSLNWSFSTGRCPGIAVSFGEF